MICSKALQFGSHTIESKALRAWKRTKHVVQEEKRSEEGGDKVVTDLEGKESKTEHPLSECQKLQRLFFDSGNTLIKKNWHPLLYVPIIVIVGHMLLFLRH